MEMLYFCGFILFVFVGIVGFIFALSGNEKEKKMTKLYLSGGITGIPD